MLLTVPPNTALPRPEFGAHRQPRVAPGCSVMGVVPGWIGLDRAHREWAALTPDQQREVGPLIPPQDIANTVVSLLDHGRPGEVVEILRKGEQTSTAAR